MALIECPGCGKVISDRATECPHCGERIDRDEIARERMHQRFERCRLPLFALLVISIGIALISFVLFNVALKEGHAPLRDFSYYPLGVGGVGGLVCIGLAIYGLCKKNKSTALKCMVTSLILLLPFWIASYALVEYNVKTYTDFCQAKTNALSGTYEFFTNGKRVTFFCTHGGGNCYIEDEWGSCHQGGVKYKYVYDGDYYTMDLAVRDIKFSMHGSADTTLSCIKVAEQRIPVSKVSDALVSWEKMKTKQKNKLAEFRDFRTTDLSVLRLHGKVKEMIEQQGSDEDVYKFNPEGKLVEKARRSVGDTNGEVYIIKRGRNKLGFSEGGTSDFPSKDVYEVDKLGRLKSFYFARGEYMYTITYSVYNSNGWPTFYTKEYITYGDTIQGSIEYSDLDKYGNYRKSEDESGGTAYRTITYYPVGL